MLPKKDIIESFFGSKISEMTVGEISLKIKPSIAELSICLGEHKTDQYIYETSNLFARALLKDYSRLFILEVITSIDFCFRGLSVEIKGVSVMSLISILKFYINSEERKTVKNEMENKAIALLPEKTAWTNEDHLNAMRKRYRENLHIVRNGGSVKDLGGLLFEHLQKLGMVEITQEDYNSVTENLINKKKNDPFNVEIRTALNSDNIKKILARETALTNYFKMEIAMRDEYQKIKNDSSGK